MLQLPQSTGEPASQDTGRRRLGRVAPRRHVALLRPGDGARSHRRRVSGRSFASRRAGPPPPNRTPGAPNRYLAERRSKSAGVLLVVVRPVGPPARRAVRRAVPVSTPRSAMLDRRLRVGDLGCGTGQLSARSRRTSRTSWPSTLRPRCWRLRARAFRRWRTWRSAAATSKRCPSTTDSSTSPMLALVLHHVPDPGRASRRPGASLQPGGRVLIVDMLPHDRERLPAADGTCVARVRRAADPPVAGERGLYRRALRWPADRGDGEGPGTLSSPSRPDRRRLDTSNTRTRRDTWPPPRPLHPFDAAKEAGREPFKVKDLSLAEFGRKEIRLAEHEMPGLMALRAAVRRQQAAGGREDHGLAAHDGADGRAHRDAGRARRRRALGRAATSSRRRITRPRPSSSAVPKPAARSTNPKGTPVFAWKGETLDGVLVVHRARRSCGPTASGPDADRRRRRRRDAASCTRALEFEKAGKVPGVQRRERPRRVGRHPRLARAVS